MPKSWGALDDEVRYAAEALRRRLGAPDVGVVLGSGWSSLASALGAGAGIPRAEIPGFPQCRADGHDGGVAVAEVDGARYWLFLGRVHRYEDRAGAEIAFPVRVLAAARARGVVLTCAAGGLLEGDRPGDFAVVRDHVNLQGTDPIAEIPTWRRDPAFLDLVGVYDAGWGDAIAGALRESGTRVRDGVLAAMRGPCYETPAEVRMLRALGADLASMSVVPEAIAARYEGLRVAALTCISNRGAGMDAASIRHGEVLEVVRRAVAGSASSWVGTTASRGSAPARQRPP